MPEITLTEDEQQRLDAVCTEFDPATHPLTRFYFEGLEDAEEREFVINFHRASLRRRLWGALLLDTLASHEMVSGAVGGPAEMILNELEKPDPQSREDRGDGLLSMHYRDFIGDTIGGYLPKGQFACNQILQKVNQGKGRAVGETQDRFLEVCELAIFRLLPEWQAMKMQRHLEYAQYEETNA